MSDSPKHSLTAAEMREELFGPDLVAGHKTGATERLAPSINRASDALLFEDLWQDDTLSRRERSLVTVSLMVAAGHSRELRFHSIAAMRNGVTAEQLVEVVRQMSPYIGLPATHEALRTIDAVIAEG